MIDLGTDLFGEPVLRRSAFFPSKGIRRRLTRYWADGPRALVIGCNPSDGDAEKDDRTSSWWNHWFHHFGFGGYDAANLYSFVATNPWLCLRRAKAAMEGADWGDRDELFSNLSYLVELAKRADKVFVCWGGIASDLDWVEHVVEEIQTGVEPWPDLWCWGTTKAGTPTHPMARGAHRLLPDQPAVLWRAA